MPRLSASPGVKPLYRSGFLPAFEAKVMRLNRVSVVVGCRDRYDRRQFGFSLQANSNLSNMWLPYLLRDRGVLVGPQSYGIRCNICRGPAGRLARSPEQLQYLQFF